MKIKTEPADRFPRNLVCMEGYQGHNSNTPYALFHLRYTGVNHALSQSDMLHTFFENSLLDNSIWVLC